MKKVNVLYVRDNTLKQINFLYAGTFYKSAFTNEFKEALSIFAGLEISQHVKFTFVLSQYDDDSVAWLKSTMPNVEIKLKLERPIVLELIKTSDCMFVVDSLLHKNLLKGKLIEAISYGIPVFAATYKNSVMDKVVKEYGGLSAYQDLEGDLLHKMKSLIFSIQSDKWLQTFYSQRSIVLDKISENAIVKSTKAVNDFAYCRFNKIKKEKNSLSVLQELKWP
jgi:glycosyltransferase involved in cell wall biosynthesis